MILPHRLFSRLTDLQSGRPIGRIPTMLTSGAGMAVLNRRMFLSCAVAASAIPNAAAGPAPLESKDPRRETHRFRTIDFDVSMTVEYYDGYSSSAFRFRHGASPQ